jgi:hypothetical protein
MHCYVKAIISLPRGIFETGTETSGARKGSQKKTQKMLILFLRKRKVLLKTNTDLDIYKSENVLIASIEYENEHSIGRELKTIAEQFNKIKYKYYS